MKRITVVALLALALGCGRATVPAGQPALVKLHDGNLNKVRDAFNGASSQIRVLALLSPS